MVILTAFYFQIELTRLESNGLDDGSTSTSDPLPAIRSAIASNKNINKIYLCSPVDHFHAAPGDQGKQFETI